MLINLPFQQFIFLIHLIHLLIQLYHLMPKKIPFLLQIKHFLIRPFLHHLIIQLCPQLFQLLEHLSDLLFQGIHIHLLDQLYTVLNLRVYVLWFIRKVPRRMCVALWWGFRAIEGLGGFFEKNAMLSEMNDSIRLVMGLIFVRLVFCASIMNRTMLQWQNIIYSHFLIPRHLILTIFTPNASAYPDNMFYFIFKLNSYKNQIL